MRKFKRLTMTLALLIMAAGGAWAEETPLLTIESNGNRTFGNGSKTFGGMVTVTFSNSVSNDGDEFGWYTSGASLLTVAGTNGYTITSCKFYTDMGTASTGYTVVGESPSVYLSGSKVYTDDSKSVNIGQFGITKIEVYGTEPIELKPDDTGKNWFLAKMPASNVELQVEYEPTKVTMAVNDKTMGTVEVAGESKVEWTADTWNGWTFDTKEYTVDDITMTSTNSAYIQETKDGLDFFVNQTDDNSTVTFSTTGDPFSRIEFTMIDDYAEDQWVSTKGVYLGNPVIMPKDNWTFSGKSAVWEGEATKSLTLQSCTTMVSKITFFKGAVPDGVTVNGDGTFTVAKTATVTLTATPAEGYKFLYWEDDQTNTNPVREVTIEPGEADMTYTAVFEEITYNVTFVEGTDLNEWTATPNTEVKKDTKVDIKYNGAKKVIGMKVEKKVPIITWDNTNVFVKANQGKNVDKWNTSATFEGITISFNGEGTASHFYPYDTMGADLDVLDYGDSFTFTAPTGKKFAKIEINGSFSNLNDANWSTQANGIVWSNTPSNTVTIATTESYSTDFEYITSIVFTLSE